MRILGIDPGLATVGYGVIDYSDGQFALVDYGAIITTPDLKMPERLDVIFNEMLCLLDTFRPDSIAFEELFFAKNVKTAINVAHARGVLLASAYQYTKELYEYTPLQVKQAIVGYGRADKRQIHLGQQDKEAFLRSNHDILLRRSKQSNVNNRQSVQHVHLYL